MILFVFQTLIIVWLYISYKVAEYDYVYIDSEDFTSCIDIQTRLKTTLCRGIVG